LCGRAPRSIPSVDPLRKHAIAEAIKLLSDLKTRSASGYSNASEVALIYAALGDKDQAMTWLEKGYEERFKSERSPETWF
jgi:hypothetical protein